MKDNIKFGLFVTAIVLGFIILVIVGICIAFMLFYNLTLHFTGDSTLAYLVAIALVVILCCCSGGIPIQYRRQNE